MRVAESSSETVSGRFCPSCGRVVSGRPNKVFCSERCRKANWSREHLGHAGAKLLLIAMSDAELRAFLREVLVQREALAVEASGREPAPGGRFRVRWGKRQPSA